MFKMPLKHSDNEFTPSNAPVTVIAADGTTTVMDPDTFRRDRGLELCRVCSHWYKNANGLRHRCKDTYMGGVQPSLVPPPVVVAPETRGVSLLFDILGVRRHLPYGVPEDEGEKPVQQKWAEGR